MVQNEIDLQVLKVVVNKLDETLEKISESTNTIGKLLAVHADKIQNLEKDQDVTNKELKEVYNKMEKNTKEILQNLKDMESRIEDRIENNNTQSSNQHAVLSNKVDKLDERLKELEKWRWYIAGSLGLIAFVLTNSESVFNFLKH
ncbi:hypothetical protein UFOVP84_149 [uncultured Caudovirales phage]|uniref:DUF7201 domain-containing protein n=1 Tax=uncultured Caudovirales phage TaxID=2100421 RepID=A0A6J5L184_9CAUD|nr:hypothetical protein UFOVP84_149 [uncultured Caudovirales phage]